MPQYSFIIRTKIRPPSVAAGVSIDPRLVRLLEPERHRLALVSAPAGYGKTTLLGTWAEQWEGFVAWLSLDEADNDANIFLAHLAAALHRAVPARFDQLQRLASTAEPPTPRVFGGMLANAVLDLEEPLLLVIDEYQEIRKPVVHGFVEALVTMGTETLTLALGTRRDPPLAIGSLRSRASTVEVRASDLRLTHDQAAAVLERASTSRPSPEVVDALNRTHEGWVTGLRLAGLAHRARPWGAVNDEWDADASLDLLLAEVLQGFPPGFADRLRAVSIFERFNADLFDYVLQEDAGSGATFIARMEEENLFLERFSGWVRIHGLLRTLLGREMEADPLRVSELHRRASRWFSEHGLIEEALAHAGRAQDADLAASVVRENREVIAETEQWNRLERWIAALPQEVVETDAELLALAAWSADNRGNFQLMASRLDRLDAAVGRLEDPDRRLSVEGEAACLRAVQYYQEERGEECLRAALDALATLPQTRRGERAYACIVASMAYQMIGDAPAAWAQIDGLLEGARGSGTFHTRVLMARAFVQWIAADARGTLDTAGAMAVLSEEHDLPESSAAAALFQGMASHALGDLDGALAAVRPIVDGVYAPNAFFYSHAVYVLALSLDALGDPDDARAAANELLSRRLAGGNPHGIREAEAFLAELAIRQGRLGEATAWHARYRVGSAGVTYGMSQPDLTALRAAIALGVTSPDATQKARGWEDLSRSLRERFRQTHNTRLLIDTLVLTAVGQAASRQREAALATLSDALGLAAPGGIVQPFVDHAASLADLLRHLAQDGESAPHAGRVLEQISGSAEPAYAAEARGSTTKSPSPARHLLTDRELEILGLLAQRLSNKEIARRLFISPATVKRHAATIYGKLGVHGRREAVAVARATGLLSG